MGRRLRATVRFSDDGWFYANDGRYRLWLDIRHVYDGTKCVSNTPRTAVGLLMNPSTARAENGYLVPDRTVSKLCQFARRELCDRLIIVNVFGVRLTDSRKPDGLGVLWAAPHNSGEDLPRSGSWLEVCNLARTYGAKYGAS